MASNETWLVWQEVFRKHEAGELIDVDTLRPFKDIVGKGKEKKASVVTLLNSAAVYQWLPHVGSSEQR